MKALVIASEIFRAIAKHAEEGYPQEICGILVGRQERARASRRVLDAQAAENRTADRARDRYDLDPNDYLRVEEEADARGLEIVGIYHSHPDHPSRPSETDRDRAAEAWGAGESWSYLIIEIRRRKVVSWRSWVLREGAFEEEEVRILEDGPSEAARPTGGKG